MGLIPTPNSGETEFSGQDQNAVQTVADNIADVTTVATAVDAGTLDTVVTNLPDIATVSTDIGDVNIVALVNREVKLLANNLSNIDVVAANIAEVGNVSNNMATVLLLHSRMADLLNIQSSLPNIDAVAANESNINSVALNIPDIANIVSHMEDIHYVSAHAAELEVIYTNIDAIISLAQNPDALTTVAENIDVIIDAATYVDEINENLAKIEVIEANVIALEASSAAHDVSAGDSATTAAGSATSADASAIQADLDADRAEAAKSAAVVAEGNIIALEASTETHALNAANSASSAASSESLVTAAATDAITAKNETLTARDEAQASATQAALDATASSDSATEAEGFKTTAEAEAGKAAVSATEAKTYETNASGHATAAEGFKNTAQGQATDATNAASSAALSETNAATHATNAGIEAGKAETSATSAGTSEGNASTYADNALASASDSNDSKLAAQLAEANAKTARDDAVLAQTAAETAVTDAGTQVSLATAEATKAENSAIDANQSKEDAEAAAQSASSDATIGRVTSARELDVSKNTVGEMLAASGFVHFGNHQDGLDKTPINEGLYTQENSPNMLRMGRRNTSIAGDSKTNYPLVNIAGIVFKLDQLNVVSASNIAVIKLPPTAPDGTVTYDSATGVRVQHADAATAFAAETATNKVVTERQDLPFFEGFKEEVTVSNPHVYPNGLIQSQATEMNGIPTTRSNRPDSYYAVYDGDTTSAGLGVNYFTASTTQKALMLADPDNNLEIGVDGKVYQRRIRQRTVEGAGNGKWAKVTPEGFTGSMNFSGVARVSAQGVLDSVVSMGDAAAPRQYRGTDSTDNVSGVVGVWVAKNEDSVAVNGECFALVLPPVNRLNQGAYHPSFNEYGTASFVEVSGGVANSSASWYALDTSSTVANNKAECFAPFIGYLEPATAGGVGRYRNASGNQSGSISAGAPHTSRPDGKFYDAIYAEGQGGVDKDVRLSAWDCRNEASNQDTANKNGTARGHEKLVRTQCQAAVAASSSGASVFYHTEDTSLFNVGDSVSIVDNGMVVVSNAVITTVASNSNVSWNSSDGTYNRVSGNTYYAVVTSPTNNTVSGEFTTKDVIGDPANILATSDLANGWDGYWVPVIPDGTRKELPLSRKNLGTSTDRLRTLDNGVTWESAPNYTGAGYSTVTNSYQTAANSASELWVLNYTAKAYVTEPANNPVVFGGTEGVGDVYAACSYFRDSNGDYGLSLAESLLGIILKNSSGVRNDQAPMQHTSFINTGKLLASASHADNTHVPLTLSSPTNDSHACKALNLIGEENGQLWNYYLAEELIWDFTLDSGAEFTAIQGTDPQDAQPIGTWIEIKSGVFQGLYRQEFLASGFAWDELASTYSYYKDAEGIHRADGLLIASQWDGNGWGDDNTIKVVDGEVTGTDLNGNTVKRVCHKSVEPIGWIKNDK